MLLNCPRYSEIPPHVPRLTKGDQLRPVSDTGEAEPAGEQHAEQFER